MTDLPPGAAWAGGRPETSRLTGAILQIPNAVTLDIADCDSEPIQIPGSIQPHALLLVADLSTMIVTGGAGDIEGRLAPAWLNRPLGEILGQDIGQSHLAGIGVPSRLSAVAGISENFDAFAVRSGNAFVVELEPTPTSLQSAIDMLSDLDAASMSFDRAISMEALAQRAAEAFRTLTGFDRVMIYRFLDDDAGVVIAEDADLELGSFLHHHFPASDIPKQARALYVRNRVRAIPDVHYKPAPLTPHSPSLASLDRGRSQRWTMSQVESAGRIVQTIFEVRQNKRVRDLNRELSATIADNESLLLQKDFLVKEVSHRVQNSLQLVSGFLGLQAKAVSDPALTAELSEAQRRVAAVALVHRRLYTGGPVETVDLGRYIEDLGAELAASLGPEWREHISIDVEPVLMPADRAVNLGLLLTELVINANKYAYGGAAGPISISLRQHQNSFRMTVADRGSWPEQRSARFWKSDDESDGAEPEGRDGGNQRCAGSKSPDYRPD